jgi:hypothetical protein
MKYKSLAELKEAFASGELKGDENRLIIDNDQSYMYVGGVPVFRGGGPSDLIWEAMSLLGIECDGA